MGLDEQRIFYTREIRYHHKLKTCSLKNRKVVIQFQTLFDIEKTRRIKKKK